VVETNKKNLLLLKQHQKLVGNVSVELMLAVPSVNTVKQKWLTIKLDADYNLITLLINIGYASVKNIIRCVMIIVKNAHNKK